ncbi:hypothetical protein WG66_009092 [Moniliophthora roreri]|nr:hypothetical protein WG66_009092 [Moniliophthora roreri]
MTYAPSKPMGLSSHPLLLVLKLTSCCPQCPGSASTPRLPMTIDSPHHMCTVYFFSSGSIRLQALRLRRQSFTQELT